MTGAVTGEVTGRAIDILIVGCGAAGLAAAAELARRGHRVLGLEQYEFGHTNGSSHGTERIVRVAYADEVHADMAARSLEGWSRLEREADVGLLTATGGLDVGDTNEIALLAAQCDRVGVAVDRLSIAEANERFPMFRFAAPDGEGSGRHGAVEVMHHAASTVNADRALTALRQVAERRGATFLAGERVEGIEVVSDDRVVVRHTGGTVVAATCVIATGAWAGDSLVRSAIGNEQRLPALTVTQEQVAFHRPTWAGTWPTFVDRSEPCIYGLPTPDGLVKIGEHHTGPVIDVHARPEGLEPRTWHRLHRWVIDHLPGVEPTSVRSATCLYASYPGDTFLFDRVGPVVVGLGLSGHGFKFVPEIGRRLADLSERRDDPLNPFSLARPELDVGASGRR